MFDFGDTDYFVGIFRLAPSFWQYTTTVPPLHSLLPCLHMSRTSRPCIMRPTCFVPVKSFPIYLTRESVIRRSHLCSGVEQYRSSRKLDSFSKCHSTQRDELGHVEDPNLGMATDFYFHTGIAYDSVRDETGQAPRRGQCCRTARASTTVIPAGRTSAGLTGRFTRTTHPSQSLFWSERLSPALICTACLSPIILLRGGDGGYCQAESAQSAG